MKRSLLFPIPPASSDSAGVKQTVIIMTGPGRSPSSPWVQNAQGRANQPFHPSMSPSQASMHMSSERTSPNYFGIMLESSGNPPTSNPGSHTQKNWGSFQSSLPSPTLQLFSQESVSEGLSTLLRTESEADKGRRESALQSLSTNGDSVTRTWTRAPHSPTTSGHSNNRMQEPPNSYCLKPGQNSGAPSRGKFSFDNPLSYSCNRPRRANFHTLR